MAKQEFETWESAIKGTIGIKKFDRRGDLATEIVRGGRKVHLTPDERRYNSERAASSGQDPFANGMLVPVTLLDSSEDAEAIAANPNVLSADDLQNLFELQWKKFDQELVKITNVSALTRLMEMAVDADATVRQMQSIKQRISQVDPSILLDDGASGNTVTSFGEPKDNFAKAVTPS
jgi:hypothetical protein